MKKARRAEVFRMKRTEGWSVRKECSRVRFTKETFPTVEAAEQWIRENVQDPAWKGSPWINHILHDSHGHLMTIEDWKECCDGGGFIDYDGNGELIDENYDFIENGFVKPSHHTHLKKEFPKEAKYVMWYNR